MAATCPALPQKNYDIFGRQVSETDALNHLVRTNGYDANGRLKAQWTPTKGLTQLNYNTNGNVLSINYQHTPPLNFTYDVLGRLNTFSNALGTSTLNYTNFGAFQSALASEDGPWSSDTVSYGYSGPNLSSIALGSWSESISRDASLRPSTITSSAGTFTYGYNGASRQLASLQFPGGTTAFGYDAIGELKTNLVTHSSTTLDFHAYDYDADGFITKAYRQNGITADYGYDAIGQLLTAQAHEGDNTLRLNENLGYSYDASGNLAFRTNNTLLQMFTSDAANELSSIVRAGTLTVSGSTTNDIIHLSVNSTNAAIYSDATFATTSGMALRDGNNLFVTAGTNAAGQLAVSTVTLSSLPSSLSCSYDLNGSLVSDGLRTFDYDDANQLVRVSVPNKWKSEFTYDALGRRRITRDYTNTIGAWTLQSETRYVYDGMSVIR